MKAAKNETLSPAWMERLKTVMWLIILSPIVQHLSIQQALAAQNKNEIHFKNASDPFHIGIVLGR